MAHSVQTGRLRSIPFFRPLYLAGALLALLIVLIGFARTYYLSFAFDSPALAGPLVHLHGLVMTLWFALFLVQAALIAKRQTRLHRRLGVFGAVLASLVVIVGVATAIGFARRGVDVGMPPLVFLAIPLGDMFVFTVLAGSGLLLRRRTDFHKRLMLLASLSMLPAAVSRIPLDFILTGGPWVFFGLTDLCILPFVAVDTWRRRKLHPAFGWGVLLIIASQPLRLMLAGSSGWMQFAEWLVR